jgi:hypothetical protein
MNGIFLIGVLDLYGEDNGENRLLGHDATCLEEVNRRFYI